MFYPCRSIRASPATCSLTAWRSKATWVASRFSPTQRSWTLTPKASPPSFKQTNWTIGPGRWWRSERCPFTLTGNLTWAQWTSSSEWGWHQHTVYIKSPNIPFIYSAYLYFSISVVKHLHYQSTQTSTLGTSNPKMKLSIKPSMFNQDINQHNTKMCNKTKQKL